MTDLDSDTWAGEVKRIRGKKLPLTAVGLHALRDEYTRTVEPARTLATAQTRPIGAAACAYSRRTR